MIHKLLFALAMIVFIGALVFIGVLIGSCSSADPCAINAPMEQSHCRVTGGNPWDVISISEHKMKISRTSER